MSLSTFLTRFRDECAWSRGTIPCLSTGWLAKKTLHRDTREICDDAEAEFRVEVDVRSRISLRVDFKHQQIDNPSQTFTLFTSLHNREIFDASTVLPLPRIISLHLNVIPQNTRTSVLDTKQPNLITSIYEHKIIIRCAHGRPNRHSRRCGSEQLRRNG